MYQALYRKWRPKTFSDIIGQEAIVSALSQQITAEKVGHAYMFTGSRGTGKTSCAKVFAKAVNCENPTGAEPCGQCPMCVGLEDGSILDVAEIDAASNNGVDDVRELREETMFRPSRGKYRVYIIDEVHMLSTAAFNALLKTLEEPPSHVIFILATTEIHKVPATILSRCQRFDFMRIPAEKIAVRLEYIAQQENIDLNQQGADLIARLADGAMRDALSLLDTCAGVGQSVTAELVRTMAGVADKSYLFAISNAVEAQDFYQILDLIGQLKHQSIDVRRLCEELIFHYRNILLALAKKDGSLLESVQPDDRRQYMEFAAKAQDASVITAMSRLAAALDKMGRSPDPRIELELALIDLCQPNMTQQPKAAPSVAAAPPPRRAESPPPPPAAEQPAPPPAPAAAPAPSPLPMEPAPLAEMPQGEGTEQLFEAWPAVLEEMARVDRMLSSYMTGTKAYAAGSRILIEGSSVFLTYMRENDFARERIKSVIEKVSGRRFGIGPYESKTKSVDNQPSVTETLRQWQDQGVDVTYENKVEDES